MLVASSPRRRSPSPAPVRSRAGRLQRTRRSSTSRRRQSLCRDLQNSRQCQEQRTSHCQASPASTKAAYGELLAVHGVESGNITTQDSPLTSLGYSGEHFDARLQQQYLRARWYDPANGRFNRLDPFAGNTQDPQSLHKYAYVHGDPVQGVDPTGLEVEAFDETDPLTPSGKGVRAHNNFSRWIRIRYGIRNAGATLATVLPEHFATGDPGFDLKPDLVRRSDQTYYELKPVTHERKGSFQWDDYDTQLVLYDTYLPPYSYDRGRSNTVVPYSHGGLTMGYFRAQGKYYRMIAWPEQRTTLTQSGLPGGGLLYYDLREIDAPDPRFIPSIIKRRPGMFEEHHDVGNDTKYYTVLKEHQDLVDELEKWHTAARTITVLVVAGALANRAGMASVMSAVGFKTSMPSLSF